VYSFLIFFGIGWGVTAPMFMSVAADLFKGKMFGLIYGIVEGALVSEVPLEPGWQDTFLIPLRPIKGPLPLQ